MSRLGDLSIRYKLTVLFMAISGFTALAVSVPTSIYDEFTSKRAVSRNLAILSESLASNITAAETLMPFAGTRCPLS